MINCGEFTGFISNFCGRELMWLRQEPVFEGFCIVLGQSLYVASDRQIVELHWLLHKSIDLSTFSIQNSKHSPSSVLGSSLFWLSSGWQFSSCPR